MEWISVKHRVPLTYDRVLVIVHYLDAPYENGRNNVSKSNWTEPHVIITRAFNFNNCFEWDCNGKVTHWMPLPTSPENYEI